MKKLFSFLFALLAMVSVASSQLAMGTNRETKEAVDTAINTKLATLYQKKLFINGNDTLPYRILLPELYDSTKKYPMVLFLHGSGESGRDNEKQLIHGASLFVKDDNLRKFHSIVVFPQCPEESYWSNVKRGVDPNTKKETFAFQPAGEPTKAMSMAIALENKLLNEYPVNKERVYVMGLSMGGMGTYEIVRRMPGVFAAAIPMCGGADTSTAKQIKKTAFWIIHGAKDDVISPKYSEDMIQAFYKFYTTADMQYTVYPDANHNCWDLAFKEPTLLEWLFGQVRMK